MSLGFRLLCITDRGASKGRDLCELISVLAGAGLRALQIREKDLPDAAFRGLAARILKATENMPVRMFVHSRVAIAREFGAGLHLADGADVAGARKEVGPDAVIGVSCHSLESALTAEKAGASFVMYGPVFSPISKSSAVPPAGLNALTAVSKAVPVPVVAVGGISPKNAASCLNAGAQAVASIGSLLAAEDVRMPLLDFMRALGRL